MAGDENAPMPRQAWDSGMSTRIYPGNEETSKIISSDRVHKEAKGTEDGRHEHRQKPIRSEMKRVEWGAGSKVVCKKNGGVNIE